MAAPSDVGRTMIRAMEESAYRVVAGSDARTMDRLSRLAPKRAAELIQKQMRELLQ